MPMETFMKESGKMIRPMDMVSTCIKMEQSMKEIGGMISKMDMV
jgi:hypothetical protein